MKKFFLLFLVLCMLLLAFSSAESVDILPDYSLDELYIMRDYISSVILSRSSWKSVTLPVGYYVVGIDIPAGHWTISYSPGDYSLIEYYKNTDETGKNPADVLHDYYYEGLSDPDLEMASVYKYREIDLDLKPDYHFVVNNGPVVFTPFTGRYSPFFQQ